MSRLTRNIGAFFALEDLYTSLMDTCVAVKGSQNWITNRVKEIRVVAEGVAAKQEHTDRRLRKLEKAMTVLIEENNTLQQKVAVLEQEDNA